MKLWLDDERPAPDGWVAYKDPFRFISALSSNVEEISLDHDLGIFIDGQEVTGYDVINYIEKLALAGEWAFVPQKINIHTANPVARVRMQLALRNIEKLRDARTRRLRDERTSTR